MGSIGGSMARSVENRGLVSGASVGQLTGGRAASALSGFSSGVAHNPHSLFLTNPLQSSQPRSVNDMIKHMQGLRSYESSSNSIIGGLHSNFSNDSTPPMLDLSEFPSLTSRSSDSSQPNPMAGRQPYVGMVKQPTSETAEFTMSNEDFPALPGSQSASNKDKKGNSNSSDSVSDSTSHRGLDKTQKQGILISQEGKVTNIPPGMVNDQFGIIGILSAIRGRHSEGKHSCFTEFADLTTFGLNLQSSEPAYPTFGSPWSETPCRPQDIDFQVPQEYLTNHQIRGKLPLVSLDRYEDDLLFYLFYSSVGDRLQLLAADELHKKNWIYLDDQKVWITPGRGRCLDKMNYKRGGTCYYFDVQNWKKVPKDFLTDYDKLDKYPLLPPSTGPLPHTPTSGL